MLHKRKPKLFKHFIKYNLDIAIITFQWFLTLFGLNWSREISESIWDFLLLEGIVAIFKASFAILNILEHQLLKTKEFEELYLMLTVNIEKHVTSPTQVLKHMRKYSKIKISNIKKLRNLYRETIVKEQKEIWQSNRGYFLLTHFLTLD